MCSITLEEAKEVHRSLKLAAGMFLNIKDHILPKLPASTEKGVDTDSRVVEAYAQMSQGEAQEVTLARALELGHKPAVVTSLALETSAIFTQACQWEGLVMGGVFTLARAQMSGGHLTSMSVDYTNTPPNIG